MFDVTSINRVIEFSDLPSHQEDLKRLEASCAMTRTIQDLLQRARQLRCCFLSVQENSATIASTSLQVAKLAAVVSTVKKKV